MSEADVLKDWNDRGERCHCGKDGHALNSINCPVHGDIAVRLEDLGDNITRAEALKEIKRLRSVLMAVDHTLTVHDHIDGGTPLHDRVTSAVASHERSTPEN